MRSHGSRFQISQCHDCGNYVRVAENPKEYSKSDQRPDGKSKAQAHKTLKVAA